MPRSRGAEFLLLDDERLPPQADMNIQELREMSDEQLQLTANEAAEKLFRLRFQSESERLDTPTEIRANRRLIARIKTIQTQRVMAAASSPS